MPIFGNGFKGSFLFQDGPLDESKTGCLSERSVLYNSVKIHVELLLLKHVNVLRNISVEQSSLSSPLSHSLMYLVTLEGTPYII